MTLSDSDSSSARSGGKWQRRPSALARNRRTVSRGTQKGQIEWSKPQEEREN